MNGAFMLVAFMLGFWCIWSANREPNSLFEGLTLTIIAIIAKAMMEWSGMPSFTPPLLLTWGILYVFNVIALELVLRFSSSMATNMVIAVGSGLGWFFLAKYLFSPAGSAMVAGWIG